MIGRESAALLQPGLPIRLPANSTTGTWGSTPWTRNGFVACSSSSKAEPLLTKAALRFSGSCSTSRLKGETVEAPETIVVRLNLAKTTGDDGALLAAVKEVITENPKAVEDYRAGKNGALNFLVGQTMKKTRGRADPGELNRMMVAALRDTEQ